MDASARSAAASADEAAASHQIQDDPQLLALHRIFTNSKVIDGCVHHKIVWAQVKGYPWWPVRSAVFYRLAASGARTAAHAGGFVRGSCHNVCSSTSKPLH